MSTQAEKQAAFQSLHAQGTFILANAWDPGSARILEGLGARAIATSSAAAANTLARRDGGISRAEAIAHATAIAAAVDLPVSADLENGFGHTPADVAETVAQAAAANLCGCTIEDASGTPENPIYAFDHALARIQAAVAARPPGFLLTARAEALLRGSTDIAEIIRRLQAYEAAGADVLMAPGLPDLAAIRAVTSAVSKPVNFMAGIPGKSPALADLAAAGIRRVSLATSLYRAAMTGLIAAAEEALNHGTFAYIDTSAPSARIAALMRPT